MCQPVMRADDLVLNFRNHDVAAAERDCADAEEDERYRKREAELGEEGNCRKEKTAERSIALRLDCRLVCLIDLDLFRLRDQRFAHLPQALFSHGFGEIAAKKPMRLPRLAPADAVANALLPPAGETSNAIETWVLAFRKRFDPDSDQSRDQDDFYDRRLQQDDCGKCQRNQNTLPWLTRRVLDHAPSRHRDERDDRGIESMEKIVGIG